METLLYTSPIVVALIGIAMGHWLRRTPLAVVTLLVVFSLILPPIATLMRLTDHSLADLILIGMIAQGSVLVMSMWITYAVKRAGGITASLKRISEATFDTGKGSE